MGTTQLGRWRRRGVRDLPGAIRSRRRAAVANTRCQSNAVSPSAPEIESSGVCDGGAWRLGWSGAQGQSWREPWPAHRTVSLAPPCEHRDRRRERRRRRGDSVSVGHHLICLSVGRRASVTGRGQLGRDLAGGRQGWRLQRHGLARLGQVDGLGLIGARLWTRPVRGGTFARRCILWSSRGEWSVWHSASTFSPPVSPRRCTTK